MKVVTGTGRCGASFVGKILGRCNYTIADESAQITHLHGAMIHSIRQEGMFFPDSSLARVLAGEYQDQMDQVSCDFSVGPRFSVTLPIWWCGGRVESVVVCVRNLFDATRSCIAGQGLGGIYGWHMLSPEVDPFWGAFCDFGVRLGHLCSFLEVQNVPHVYVRFPQTVRDFEELFQALPELKERVSLEEFKKIHAKIARSEPLHSEDMF